ncbi:MAG: hypothetical protein F6K28_57740 [Microcoleus sp. SIO2G3]|nr:hypothetical protein [Microcoleus sp. SIO2G3]
MCRKGRFKTINHLLLQPLPTPKLPPTLPPSDELLVPPQPTRVPPLLGEVPTTIRVDRYNVVGSNVFTPEELATATASFSDREMPLPKCCRREQQLHSFIQHGVVRSRAA